MADINVKVYFSAATALNGTLERLSVQPHVELLCMDKHLYLVADKGYIKKTDSVIFFRYIRNHNRYKGSAGSVQSLIHRRVIGWKCPTRNNEVKLILKAMPTNDDVFKHFKNKDLFAVGRNVDSDLTIGILPKQKFEGIITIFKALEINKKVVSVDGDRTDSNFLLFNKKCGIRIKRGQEWITDYLPFMARKDKTRVEGEYSYGIGRWA